MDSKHKNLLIGGLCAIVLVMAVGYAAFATTLNINGTAEITSSWDVHIKSISVKDGATVGTATNVSADLVDSLHATFKSELVAPSDSITYEVVVENGGSLDAKLDGLTFVQSQTNTAESGDNRAIIYSYAGITEGDVLNASDTTTFTVTVTYNPVITSQPDTVNLNSTLDMNLSYVQNK